MRDLRSEPPTELLVVGECSYCGLEVTWLRMGALPCIRRLKGSRCPGTIIPVDPPRRARPLEESKRLRNKAIVRNKETP